MAIKEEREVCLGQTLNLMGTQLLETHIKPGNIFERSPNIFRQKWLDAGAEFPWLERQNGAPSMGLCILEMDQSAAGSSILILK